jgi:hypothetical protein
VGDSEHTATVDVEALRHRLRKVSPTDSPDDTLAVLDEIERTLRFGTGTGCDEAAVAADLRHWQRLCRRLGLTNQAARASDELEGLVTRDVAQWSRLARERARQHERDPQALLQALDRAVGLSFELRETSDDSAEARARLETDRSELRAVFELTEPEGFSRSVQRAWATPWLDRAAMVLAEADDAAPDEAAVRLREVSAELAWLARCLRRGRPARRLRRKARHLEAEAQERALQARLERLFGTAFVTAFERVVFWLTLVVLALLGVQATAQLAPATAFWIRAADTAACVVFLLEYGTKTALAEGKSRWALRHALTDFLPSLPLGLLIGGPGDAVRAGRLGRLLRLPRLVRYARVLRPVLKGFRGLALLARGFDRLVRRYGRLLNHNVILYPTEAELGRAGEGDGTLNPDRQLQIEARRCWQRLVAAASSADRPGLADRRLEVLASVARAPSAESGPGEANEPVAREIPAGVLLRRLERVQPETIEAVLDRDMIRQAARAVRLLAARPMVYLPGIRQCMPSVGQDDDDSTVLAGAAQCSARLFKRAHDGWFWVADLYGTVTPSQFVDRVGGVMVKGAFRPAYRLAIAAGGLLLVQLLLQVASSPLLQQAREWLFNFAGIPVMILGGVCMVVVGIGWWFQRLAQEATEFYERSAKAQFLALTDQIRKRTIERDGRALYERVLRPHHRAIGADERPERFVRGLGDQVAAGSASASDDADERLVMLHRDWADGAPLTDSDTRATSQLLGDPTVQDMLERAMRLDSADRDRLQALDLERQKSLLGGPYLWFNLITRAVAHSVAGLLVEYNRHAIPRSELEGFPETQRQAYQRWLASEQSGAEAAARAADTTGYMTTAFTALHFLDVDPERDAAVEQRFGVEVRQRLERDRQLMIRRILGTWPLHEQPKAKRTVNLYTFYERWLAGGRALLMPLWILLLIWRILKRGLRWLIGAVKEIYQPERRTQADQADRADFTTAVRKINRIHGPLVETTIQLRARLDPEYLGFTVPGNAAPPSGCSAVDDDLAFYRAEPALWEAIRHQRRRTRADIERLRELLADGLLTRVATAGGTAGGAFDTERHRRAATVIYCADLDGIRTLISGASLLSAIAARGNRKPSLLERTSPHVRTRRRFRQFVRSHGINHPAARGALWRAVRANTDGAGEALKTWAEWGDEAVHEGERRLAEQLLRVTRIGEQLLTLRAIQTMALLDVVHYREHIHQLGGYGDASQREAWLRSSFTSEDPYDASPNAPWPDDDGD